MKNGKKLLLAVNKKTAAPIKKRLYTVEKNENGKLLYFTTLKKIIRYP